MPSRVQPSSLIEEANCGSCCSSQRPFSKSRRENEAVGAGGVDTGDGDAVGVAVGCGVGGVGDGCRDSVVGAATDIGAGVRAGCANGPDRGPSPHDDRDAATSVVSSPAQTARRAPFRKQRGTRDVIGRSSCRDIGAWGVSGRGCGAGAGRGCREAGRAPPATPALPRRSGPSRRGAGW